MYLQLLTSHSTATQIRFQGLVSSLYFKRCHQLFNHHIFCLLLHPRWRVEIALCHWSYWSFDFLWAGMAPFWIHTSICCHGELDILKKLLVEILIFFSTTFNLCIKWIFLNNFSEFDHEWNVQLQEIPLSQEAR